MVQFAIMHLLNIMVEFSKLFFFVFWLLKKVTECLEKIVLKAFYHFPYLG